MRKKARKKQTKVNRKGERDEGVGDTRIQNRERERRREGYMFIM